MRKNTLVKFIDERKGVYDPYTDTYQEDAETIEERYCNVTPLSSEQSFKEFGEYIQGGLTIRLTEPLAFVFQYVEINGKRYALRSRIESLGRTSVVVVEVEYSNDKRRRGFSETFK